MSSEIRHGLQLHPDLRVIRQHTAKRVYYVIKQMWTGKHFQVGEEEWYLMQALARNLTLAQLQRDFQRHFAPYRVSLSEIHHWLARLQSQGLLVSQHGRQGEALHQQTVRSRWQERYSLPWRCLSFRFPPISCEGLLQWLDPLARWLFHPLVLLAAAVAGIVVGGLLLSSSDELIQELATRGTFLRGDNLAALGVALIVVKVCHELAHALAARHYGAECREIGIWLMLFMPLLYCDTTDAWMIPSKWRRMAVSAAGMYVELWIAIVSSCLWWSGDPGPFRAMCLNVMVICSVGTLAFNANPLIRFDGYFILADYLGIPNLAEQAQAALWGPVEDWLSQRSSRLRLDGSRGGLVMYAIASLTYQAMLFLAVLWACYRTLSINSLQPIGDLIVLLAISGMLLLPWRYVGRKLADPAQRCPLGPRWQKVFLLALAFLLIGFVPWRSTLLVESQLELRDAARVYAVVPGQLHTWVEEGTQVAQGDVLVTLRDPDRERELSKVKGLVSSYELRLENLRKRASVDPLASAAISTTEAAWLGAKRQWETLQRDYDACVIRAPRSGIVVFPHLPTEHANLENDDLLTTESTFLSPCNRGCWITEGSLLALVAAPDAWEVIARIEQSQSLRIAVGAAVTVRPYPDLTHPRHGQVVEISRDPRPVAGRSADDAPPPPATAGSEYWARIRLDDTLPLATHGVPATARIELPPASLWSRWQNLLLRQLRFDLN